MLRMLNLAATTASAAPKCVGCSGEGRVWDDEGEQDWRRIECPDCLGSGRRR